MKNLPKIGMRMIKSATAVFLCFLFYFFFRKDGIVFYSQLAALWCMQPYITNTKSKSIQRTIGTLVGATVGLIVLLINIYLIPQNSLGNLLYYFLISISIIITLYITILIHKKDASYFSCVVFLSIVVNHISDINPYLFVLNRTLDTMIGLIIGMVVNSFHLPRRKENDILFISGMDDTLLTQNDTLSAYSLIELNRMILEGAVFTVATIRTPASLIDVLRDVHLKLPVIAMDGAVMYDIKKNEYLHAYIISKDTAKQLQLFLDKFKINYFINTLLNNTLMIQYHQLQNEAERDIYQKLHTSPYRNYIQSDLTKYSNCIYFMLIQKKELSIKIYQSLLELDYSSKLRIVLRDSKDSPGYSHIKLYHKNETRENMIQYLQKETGTKKVITFGSIPNKYDILVNEYDQNKVVKTLKNMYEPLLWKKS